MLSPMRGIVGGVTKTTWQPGCGLQGQCPTTSCGSFGTDDTRREIMRLVLLLCLLANPDGDCTKSADCERGSYCKAGTCVPKGEDNGR
jgi:hypothetical protein